MKRSETSRGAKGAATMLFAFGLSLRIVHANETGPFAGSAGVPAGGDFPAEVTCSSSGCHETFPLNADKAGKIEILNLPDKYEPGRRYSLTFRITDPESDRRRWGFQVTAVAKDTFLRAGDLVVTDEKNTQVIGGGFGNRQYVEHTMAGTAVGRTGGHGWSFDWIAPKTNVGDVAFYGGGNAANADGSNAGDKIYNPTPNPIALVKGPEDTALRCHGPGHESAS